MAIRNARKTHFKKYRRFCSGLTPNPSAQVKFFFAARCADGTESIGIKTTGIASVASPYLGHISGRIKSVCTGKTLHNSCADPGSGEYIGSRSDSGCGEICRQLRLRPGENVQALAASAPHPWCQEIKMALN